MRKPIIATLFSISALTGGYLWLGHRTPAAHANSQIRPTATIIAPGRVEPARDPVALAFETGGRIATISVEEGQTVQAGQIVAHLDDRLAKARVAAATAALAQARARLDLARRGPRREDVEVARAEAAAAAADAEHRALEQQRSDQLGAIGAVATATVDADGAAARKATATRAAADARYRSIARGTRAEVIAEADAAVAAATAELDLANVALDHCALRAPQDGVILRRMAEVGAIVTVQNPTPVVTLADLGQLEVRAEIDEADVAAIATGKVGYVTADAFADRQFPVHVARTTRELGRKVIANDDPRARIDTRVLEVILRFDTPPNIALPLGMRMYAHIAR